MTRPPFANSARSRVSQAISIRHSAIHNPNRLAALRRTGLLDSPAAHPFDRLTRLASLLLRAPVSFVSLLDEKRAFLKSQIGLPEPWAARREIPFTHSFCRHVVESGTALIIDDARTHEQVRGNPAVGEMRSVAYIGIPLKSAEGHVLGALCVIDHTARVWKPGEVGLLSELAASVITEIALQTKILEQETLLQRFGLWRERMPLACFTCGPDIRIVDWNPAASRIFGHAAHAAIGRTPEELLFAPDRGDEAAAAFSSVAQGAFFQRESVECMACNGRIVMTDWTLTPVQDPGGAPAGFVAMVEDVTARHRGKRESVALECNLIHRQKLETLGTLAGGMAHEFGNILGAILGNADLARADIGAEHPAAGALGEIFFASKRARELVRQILAYSRNERVERVPLALRPVVEESVRLLRATLPPSVNLVALTSGDVPNVLGDATQIGQVLLNLGTNAWHSMEGRSGTITIALDTVEDAPAAPAGKCARIVVRDTGGGMDAATLQRIFEPFFTTKPTGKGTGLGLAIVHGIMKAHDGAVHATSQPGEGTTFTLYFPSPTPCEPQPPVPPPENPPRGCGEHVWMLDDEESLVNLNTRALKRTGYEVSAFTDPDEALRVFRANPDKFALAITDTMMPRVSGIKVAAELRAIRPDLPIILATGHLTDSLRQSATEGGIRHVLEKPNTIAELQAAVHEALCDRKKNQP